MKAENHPVGALSRSMGAGLSVLGGSAWLVYWAGRRHKEAYFNQFNIPYEALAFDASYYLYGSWSSIAVTASILLIIANLVTEATSLLKRRPGTNWLWIRLACAILLGFAAAAPFMTHLRFQPDVELSLQNILSKVLASRDVVIMALLMPSVVLSVTALNARRKALIDLSNRVYAFYARSGDAARVLAVSLSVLMLLASWVAIGVAANVLGRYHGTMAIREGKMGVKEGRSFGKWWLVVVRTGDGRNFLYDRKCRTVRYVKDDQIQKLRNFQQLESAQGQDDQCNSE